MILYVVQYRHDEADTWHDDGEYRPFSNFYEAVKSAVESASQYPIHTRVVKRVSSPFDREVFVFTGEAE